MQDAIRYLGVPSRMHWRNIGNKRFVAHLYVFASSRCIKDPKLVTVNLITTSTLPSIMKWKYRILYESFFRFYLQYSALESLNRDAVLSVPIE
jgi:hypothetical protein